MKQPEALRLADALDADATNGDMGRKPDTKCHKRKAAAELRRLHEANQAMLEVLKEIVEMWDAFVPTDLTAEPHLKARAAIAKGEQQ